MTTTLELVKARLNRLASDTSLDDYLNARIVAAKEELKKAGIHLDDKNIADTMLLTDVVVWQYQNRDKSGAMPEWLALKRRERFLQDFGGDNK